MRGAGGRLPGSDLGAEHSESFPARSKRHVFDVARAGLDKIRDRLKRAARCFWHEADLPARPFYGRLLGLSGH